MESVIEEAKGAGLKYLIANTSKEEDHEKIYKMREKFPDAVIASYGIHPWYVENLSENWKETLMKYILSYKTNCIGMEKKGFFY